MVTGLELYKREMAPLEELYRNELRRFTEKYDALGEFTLSEFPDIDVQEYIYSFERVNGASEEELDKIHLEIHEHMDQFAKIQGIEKFARRVAIWL